MSDPVTNVEIEDVLSSIRRLVSEDNRPRAVATEPQTPDKLVLTPALRVSEETSEGKDEAEAEAQDVPAPMIELEEEHSSEVVDFSDPQGDDGAHLLDTDHLADDWSESDATEQEEGQKSSSDEWQGFEPQNASQNDSEQAPVQDAAEQAEEALQWEDVTEDAGEAAVNEPEPETTPADDFAQDIADPSEQGDEDAERVSASEAYGETEDDMSHDEDDAPRVTPHPAAFSRMRAEDDGDLFGSDEAILDEETLRELVADIVRQELQGALGERITRNVRKLVRREIHRALASHELD